MNVDTYSKRAATFTLEILVILYTDLILCHLLYVHIFYGTNTEHEQSVT